ncbi:MAG: GNAT family N-acetyltransferase [Planctomycetaceae bacterium]|nr:GNAT family N-acetyltransferase [Planctomycetaceae bacterium]
MNIRSVKVDELTPAELTAWSEIQLATPLLSNPHFRPEFTQALAVVRSDIEVAVLEEGGRPVGFLPFRRSSWNIGRPAAGPLSDYHAVIAPAGLPCDPFELVRACHLKAWRFDHLVELHPAFRDFAWSSAESPYVDISAGWDAYRKDERTSGFAKGHDQKMRKLAREIGPVRFEWHVPDPALLDQMFEWKSQQYRRTKIDDVFAHAWTRELMHRLLATQTEHFAPVFSVTYVNDRVAALTFGIRAGAVLHPWFPAYDVELGKYSPGMLHWVETLKSCEQAGVGRLDLVSGGDSYKQRMMNGSIQVLQGAVDPRSSVVAAGRAWRRTREYVRTSPMYRGFRGPARVLKSVKGWLELR